MSMNDDQEKKDRGCSHDCSCSNSGEDSYWQDIHQKDIDTEVLKSEFTKGEFDSFSVVKTRRDFLKVAGFSFTILPLAACTKSTVRKAVPYLEKNDVIVPGVPSWFATSYDGAPLLIKTREGRPIKVEGNDKSLWTKGGASAISQASILSLYDSYRLKNPKKNQSTISWDILERDLQSALVKAQKEGRRIALVTGEMKGPSKASLIEEFIKQFGKVEHFVYAPVSRYYRSQTFEKPNTEILYSFESADYVLGVGCDFLASEVDGVTYARQYADKKSVDQKKIPLRHVQVEPLLSLTGSNADDRYPLDAEEIKSFMLLLLAGVGGEDVHVQASKDIVSLAAKVAKELLAHRGRSIVANGMANPKIQLIANRINEILGNWGKTISVYQSDAFKFGNEEKFEELINSLNANRSELDVVIFWDVNPFYSYYDAAKIKSAFARVNDKFAFCFSEDETSSQCAYVAPIHHQYESWSDSISGPNELVVTQPVISPLYDTKQVEDVFLKLLGRPSGFDDYMKSVWSKKFLPSQQKHLIFSSFWTETLHDGVAILPGLSTELVFKSKNISPDLAILAKSIDTSEQPVLELYSKIAIGDGKHANNPWLQELPDPLTKSTWDNYLLISPAMAQKLGLITGDVVNFTLAHKSVEIPVLVQPGLAKRAMGMAVGYGRSVSGKVGKDLGINAYQFAQFKDGHNQWSRINPVILKTTKKYEFALTQTHHSLEGRDIIKETTFGAFKTNPKSGNEGKHHVVSMWGKDQKTGSQWAMAIDLNKCNGCSACVVSCNAENNIPVVGREEVKNRREMHWMRIDRYYKGNDHSPSVVFQPMNCQHCENAPCESVCPVLATVHSSDGLNEQVYNRCVGTRYCANNCPYKVRRFNWFDYPHTGPNENMVLNPDVAVRSRGVMEKCSMCIQRIQEAKLTAKKENRELRDGDIKLACQQSCPSDAIVFGDMNDHKSKIFQVINDPRNFTVLEELNVKPRVSYLTKIRNKE
ncbi:MAG: 4Fe-4S dicluster domain-containing protein [Bacteriovorax sp.]|nr:4Fe-4S dicluster domain-containing protein [Bacteriovorax sp.]